MGEKGIPPDLVAMHVVEALIHQAGAIIEQIEVCKNLSNLVGLMPRDTLIRTVRELEAQGAISGSSQEIIRRLEETVEKYKKILVR